MELKKYCEYSKLPLSSKPEWQNIRLSDSYYASFSVIGTNILYIIPEGTIDTEGMIAFLETRERILKESGLWDREYLILKDFSKEEGLPSREVRVLLVNTLLLEQKRGKLMAFLGFATSSPMRWIFNITRRTLGHSLDIRIVKDYQTAITKALLILNKQPSAEEPGRENASVYTKKEIDNYIDELLQFMESLTWYQRDLEINEIAGTHPFKILYDVIAVIKMDFQSILNREKQQNQLLKKSEEKYRLLSENLHDAIFISDTNLQIKSIAGNTPDTLGYQKEELESIKIDNLHSFFHPNDMPRVSEKLKTVIEQGKDTVLEARFRQKDGSYRWLELTFVPLHEKNKITDIHGFARNIDEQKLTEEKLSKIQQQLVETALQAGKVELSAGMMHDIGNILNSINISADNVMNIVCALRATGLSQANDMLMDNLQNIGDFLLKDPKGKLLPEYYINLAESIQSAQEKLKTEIVELKRKINAIKDTILTQQKYIRQGNQLERFELSSCIDDALILQDSFLRKYGVQIEKSYPKENLMYITAQRSKIIHVLINLFKNAVEAMTNTPLEQRKIRISIERKNNNTIIIISDNGIGIKQEDIDNIFLYGVTSKKEGYGFGLHTSRNYIKEMGGKLFAKSPGPGRGTDIYIQIPG